MPVDEERLRRSTDAAAWADEFAKHFTVSRRDNVGEGFGAVWTERFMHTWFANAIDSVTADQPEADNPRLVESQRHDNRSSTAPTLLWLLRRAGDEWGPFGVALAAADMTDRTALIHRLIADVNAERFGVLDCTDDEEMSDA